jgi:hypothetical protein
MEHPCRHPRRLGVKLGFRKKEPPLPIPALLSSPDPDPTAPRIADRKARAEALLEEFAVAWLGHKRSKVAWVQTDRALEDLCTRVLLFLDPEDRP